MHGVLGSLAEDNISISLRVGTQSCSKQLFHRVAVSLWRGECYISFCFYLYLGIYVKPKRFHTQYASEPMRIRIIIVD